MRYKIDDLLVTVSLPERFGMDDDVPCGSKTCGGDTCGGGGSGCHPSCTTCSQCGSDSGHLDRYATVSYPEWIAAAKLRLRVQLAELEARERVLEDSMRPKTLAEIEILEAKLTAALGSLRHQREVLVRAAKKE